MVRGGDTVMAGIVCIFRSVGTSVLSDNIQELEGGLDDVKAMCQTTKKHLLACLSGNVGSDFERRLVCTHVNNYDHNHVYKELSCHRETAQCFVLLNISLSHSRSFKVIENNAVQWTIYDFLLVGHCKYSSTLYHFRDIARYWPKIGMVTNRRTDRHGACS